LGRTLTLEAAYKLEGISEAGVGWIEFTVDEVAAICPVVAVAVAVAVAVWVAEHCTALEIETCGGGNEKLYVYDTA